MYSWYKRIIRQLWASIKKWSKNCRKIIKSKSSDISPVHTSMLKITWGSVISQECNLMICVIRTCWLKSQAHNSLNRQFQQTHQDKTFMGVEHRINKQELKCEREKRRKNIHPFGNLCINIKKKSCLQKDWKAVCRMWKEIFIKASVISKHFSNNEIFKKQVINEFWH